MFNNFLEKKRTPLPNLMTDQQIALSLLALGPKRSMGRQTGRKMEAVPNKKIFVLRNESLKT